MPTLHRLFFLAAAPPRRHRLLASPIARLASVSTREKLRELRANYGRLLTFSPGVYDFPKAYHGKGPGTPQQWQNDLTISLRAMDTSPGVTWAYSEARLLTRTTLLLPLPLLVP